MEISVSESTVVMIEVLIEFVALLMDFTEMFGSKHGFFCLDVL